MEKKFKAFDRVIIKDSDGIWQIDFYSYQDSDDLHHVMTYGESNSFINEDILPYEGNEHLVGRVDEPDEEVRVEEGEWIMVNDYTDAQPHNWYLRIFSEANYSRFRVYITPEHMRISSESEISYQYAIRFSDFNPNDMEETKRHILVVKNGRIIRYKG